MVDRDAATPAGPRRKLLTDAAIAALVAAVALGALVATSRDIAMGFDEGFTVRRDLILADWFAWVFARSPSRPRWEAFSPAALEAYWPFSREEPDGHPPFYAILGVAGWRLTRGIFHPLTAFRFGPMALTAATAGALCLFLSRRCGRLAGVSAAAMFLFLPRTFTHAHYAHYDMPVTCLWLLAQVAFVKSLRARPWALAFGVLLGLAAATKFTGWFAVVPPAVWVAVVEGRSLAFALLRHVSFSYGPSRPSATKAPAGLAGTWSLAIGLPVAALTLYAVQPPWWSDPVRGLSRFLVSNLTRDRTVIVQSLYLGELYPFALPWHNTLVLTAITVPVFVLALGVVGLAGCLARGRSEPEWLIWPLSWFTLMVVRALPNAPGHDVERLLLPSFASLSVLAGLGAGWLARGRLRPVGFALLALAAGETAVGYARTYPYLLSYYNFAIGGLPGAERHGFEPTYYWDTLGPEFLGWVRREARRAGKVELRFPNNLLNVMFLRSWGDLPPDIRVEEIEPTEFAYYVQQRSPGIYMPADWLLDREGHPCFTVARQGVDLLRVYPYSESLSAYERTRGMPLLTRPPPPR
jgi:hypothetical protein